MWSLALLALVTSLTPVGGIFIPYFKSRNHSDNAFHIAYNMMDLDANVSRFGQDLDRVKAISRQYSLDERCEAGMPLSIAWHQYSPYVTLFKSVHNRRVGFTVDGMFPSIMNQMLQACCHPNSTVLFGKFLKSVRHAEDTMMSNEYDMTFPLYGYDAFSRSFRGHAFLQLVRAPRIILLVHDDPSKTRTHVLFTTIISAWPMLIFILVTASLSGIIIWFLDHSQNPDEFPPPFLRGAWEGFWWALVTMTTVGYGDRSPKSAFGRVFCIVWIITGVIIVSIFTALVTASLSASTYPNFKIHGSKIGAVNGSEEYRLGVSMNADMKVFPSIYKMTSELLTNDIDGALVDNYVITYFLKLIRDEPIRVEKYIDHSITYGVALALNSSRLEACMREYFNDYPHEVFESIAEKLSPLKNPTDDVSPQLKAAEALFYQEDMFATIMYAGLGSVGFLFAIGFIWEMFCRRPKLRNQRMQFNSKMAFNSNDETVKLQPTDETQYAKLDTMIAEYQMFHESWIDNLKKLRDKQFNAANANHITGNRTDV
ncbi:predicted protein [Nematostella vectensis]|uniref:Potassium channel domain-containing protein n=1 Tax=Nematostella vectensis TaxID=45351 RepID=A7SBV3_NEMVE|nr:predicted protein [Nematostella vectensis]|eukprot:XP_001630923.1 predicted protein [Nematostella vectensis]